MSLPFELQPVRHFRHVVAQLKIWPLKLRPLQPTAILPRPSPPTCPALNGFSGISRLKGHLTKCLLSDSKWLLNASLPSCRSRLQLIPLHNA